jgi:putative aldouronate transport system substrate-binding protein
LLALNDYISQEATPNIIKLFAETPGAEAAVTLPNGKIYGLPIVGQIYNMGYYNGSCWWYNQNYFDEAGVVMPKTVDEMLEALRTIKAAAGTGSIPADVIPLGGSSNAQTPYWLLINAFGLISSGSGFTSIALVDGQPQVICYDKERFPAFLRYIRTLYEEGLISQDFFSMDGTQVDGQKANGLYAVSSFLPALMPNKADTGSVADWSDFWAMGTLSSQYNTTGEVADIPSANRFSVGSFAASSSTADPELIARFADFWYSDEGTLISAQRHPGFDQEQKYTLDMFTVRWNEEVGNTEAVFPDGKINTVEIGQSEYLTPVYPFLCYQDYLSILYKAWDKEYTKKYNDAAPSNWDPYRDAANIDRSNMDRWAVTIYDKFMPHTTGTPYPSIIYMDEETSIRAADINSLLDDYARQEVAKFIIGTREINETELADFFANLETMGIQEYLGYYIAAYETYK